MGFTSSWERWWIAAADLRWVLAEEEEMEMVNCTPRLPATGLLTNLFEGDLKEEGSEDLQAVNLRKGPLLVACSFARSAKTAEHSPELLWIGLSVSLLSGLV